MLNVKLTDKTREQLLNQVNAHFAKYPETKPLGLNRVQDKTGINDAELVLLATAVRYVKDDTIGLILSDAPNQISYPSDRDLQVALTVLQWLGSNVGKNVIDELLEEVEPEPQY